MAKNRGYRFNDYDEDSEPRNIIDAITDSAKDSSADIFSITGSMFETLMAKPNKKQEEFLDKIKSKWGGSAKKQKTPEEILAEKQEQAQKNIEETTRKQFQSLIDTNYKAVTEQIAQFEKSVVMSQEEKDQAILKVLARHEDYKALIEDRIKMDIRHKSGETDQDDYDRERINLNRKAKEANIESEATQLTDNQSKMLQAQQGRYQQDLYTDYDDDFYDERPTQFNRPIRNTLTPEPNNPIEIQREQKQANIKRQEIQREQRQGYATIQARAQEQTQEFRTDTLESYSEIVSLHKDTNEILTDLINGLKDGDFKIQTNASGGADTGGIFDNLMNFGGKSKKGLGKIASKGMSLVKGAGSIASKVALPLTALWAGYNGIKEGADSDAIAEYEGKDPNDVGLYDRIKHGGAGAIASILPFVDKENVTSVGEKMVNFVTGGGWNNNKELKEQGQDPNKHSVTDALFNMSPLGMATKAFSLISGSDNAESKTLEPAPALETVSDTPQPYKTEQQLAHESAAQAIGVSTPSASAQPAMPLAPIESVETQPQIAPSVITNNNTTVMPEQPRYRILDSSTYDIARIGG